MKSSNFLRVEMGDEANVDARVSGMATLYSPLPPHSEWNDIRLTSHTKLSPFDKSWSVNASLGGK